MRIIRRIGRCGLLLVVLLLCLGWARSFYYHDEITFKLNGEDQDAELSVWSGRGYLQAHIARDGEYDDIAPAATIGTWVGIGRDAEGASLEMDSARLDKPVRGQRRFQTRCDNYRFTICGRSIHVMETVVPYWGLTGLVGVPLLGMLAWGAWHARHPRQGFSVLQVRYA